jgi:hypothetical protein
MFKRGEPYKSGNRQPRILRFATALLVAAVIFAWIFRDRIGIDTGSLFILTGIVGLVLVLSSQNRRKRLELDASDDHLERNREMIGTDDYRE